MAAITVLEAVETTPQTNTSASTWSTAKSIPSASFVVGETYRIQVEVYHKIGSSNATLPQLRVSHGSTVFPSSDPYFVKTRFPAVDLFNCEVWQQKWVAVSGEAINLEMLSTHATRTQTADHIVLTAMRLTGQGLTENVDWWWAEVDRMASPLDLTTSAQDGASVTFTPTAGDKFLVFAANRIKVATTGIDSISRISESQGGTTTPQKRHRNQNASAIWNLFNVYPVTLASAVSTTIKEQALLSAAGAAGDSSTFSSIFVLRLSAFKDVSIAYTDGLVSLGNTTDYETNIQTATLTMTATGDAYVIASTNYEPNALTRFGKHRGQVNPDGVGLVDFPAGVTTDAYQDEEGNGSNDERHASHQRVINFTSGAARTINLDASAEAAGAEARCRAIAAFSLELSAAPDDGTKQPYLEQSLPIPVFRRPVPIPY